MSRRWLPCVALFLLVDACGGSPEAGSSVDVIERLRTSETVSVSDGAMCHDAIPAALASETPPPVLATDRVSYAEVADAMTSDEPQALTAVPKLSADAVVTLCLLDTRAMPAAPFPRSILAVSGDDSWWAGGKVG